MHHPYRDRPTLPSRSASERGIEIRIAIAFVWLVAFLRCALAVVHHEAPMGDPALAALVVIALATKLTAW